VVNGFRVGDKDDCGATKSMNCATDSRRTHLLECHPCFLPYVGASPQAFATPPQHASSPLRLVIVLAVDQIAHKAVRVSVGQRETYLGC